MKQPGLAQIFVKLLPEIIRRRFLAGDSKEAVMEWARIYDDADEGKKKNIIEHLGPKKAERMIKSFLELRRKTFISQVAIFIQDITIEKREAAKNSLPNEKLNLYTRYLQKYIRKVVMTHDCYNSSMSFEILKLLENSGLESSASSIIKTNKAPRKKYNTEIQIVNWPKTLTFDL